MSELSYNRIHSPPTPRQLNLLVPSSWDSDSESTTAKNDTEHVIPHNDINLLADVTYDNSNPAPHTLFATQLSDDCSQGSKEGSNT